MGSRNDSNPRREHRLAAGFLAIQAVSVIAWWGVLVTYPASIALFRNHSTPDSVILDFWLADLGLVAGGSALVSFLVWRGSRAQVPAVWTLAGAVLYATLFCVGASLRSGGGWLAVGLMLSASIGTVVCAISLTRR